MSRALKSLCYLKSCFSSTDIFTVFNVRSFNHLNPNLGAVVAKVVHWTTGQQVDQSILHHGHHSRQTLSQQSMLSLAQYSLTMQTLGIKLHSFDLTLDLHYHKQQTSSYPYQEHSESESKSLLFFALTLDHTQCNQRQEVI